MNLWFTLIIAFVVAAVVSLAAWRSQSLSISGAVAATLLGTIIFGLGGWNWAILLLGFFISSSGLSHFANRRKAALSEKFSKGSQRDWAQVAANGGIAGLFVLLHAFFPGAIWPWLGFSGALAAANADTWATELGVLSRGEPHLITNGKPVERGTSGAVSFNGTLSALAGAFLIAVLAAIFWSATFYPSPTPDTNQFAVLAARIGLITLAGLAGSLLDSLLGATIQSIYYCPRCKKETERYPLHTCGQQTRPLRGWLWMDNDWVNTFCTLGGAVLAVALGLIFSAALKPAPQTILTTPKDDFSLTSPSFAEGYALPVQYTCSGSNITPELAWNGLPNGTRSIAIVLQDPDAPFTVFDHWLIYNIPPDLASLPINVLPNDRLGGIAVQGINDFGQLGYGGPCPPVGSQHRYIFNAYALNLAPDLPAGMDSSSFSAAIKNHILGRAHISVLFLHQ